MLESVRKALDKGLYTGILLTDLSRAFDSISHDLLIAKLQAYGFSKKALKISSIIIYPTDFNVQKYAKMLVPGLNLSLVSHKAQY